MTRILDFATRSAKAQNAHHVCDSYMQGERSAMPPDAEDADPVALDKAARSRTP